MDKLKIGSAGIFYEYTKGKSPCIAFIHGLGANMTVWGGEIKYFSRKGFEILSLDLRGHGLSECSRKPGFSDFSRDLHAILRRNKISKAILVGHSMGGMVALDYYRKHPENVKAMVLINSCCKISPGTLKLLAPLEVLALQIIGFFSRYRKKPMHIDFQKLNKKSDFGIVFELASSLDAFPYTISILKDMINLDFRPMLHRIKVPVLIMPSNDDEFFSVSGSRKMAELIPKGHFHLIKGTHTGIIKWPGEVSRVIDKFLSDCV